MAPFSLTVKQVQEKLTQFKVSLTVRIPTMSIEG